MRNSWNFKIRNLWEPCESRYIVIMWTNRTEMWRMNNRRNEGERRSIRGTCRRDEYRDGISFSPFGDDPRLRIHSKNHRRPWVTNESIKCHPCRPIESTIILTRWRGYFALFHEVVLRAKRVGATSTSPRVHDTEEVRKILAIKGKHAVLSDASGVQSYCSGELPYVIM